MPENWRQLVGEVVAGEFWLREYLGGSEHTAVYRTERSGRADESFAIKLVPAVSEAAEPQRSRWKQTAELTHPHLVRLFDIGHAELGGRAVAYLVSEFAEEDLARILPQRPLTPEETRDMLLPALEALAFIHGRGFVHAHFKPANIMAVSDCLKISSDGICRSGEHLKTRTAYDAPELASTGYSSATDVWSLGMTLVEVLTRKLPDATSAPSGDPLLPAGLPEPFREIARNCLKRHPFERWKLDEISARLRQPGVSSVAQAMAPTRRQTTKPRQHPETVLAKARYIGIGAAVGLAFIAALIVPRFWKSPANATRAPEVSAPAAKPEHRKAPPAGDEKPAPRTPAPSEIRTTPAGKIVKGEVTQQELPEISQKARDSVQGKLHVSVRVRVDTAGNVAEATLDTPGPSKYFADQALQAAELWEFKPAQLNGKDVESEWILHFGFTNKETQVSPVEVTP